MYSSSCRTLRRISQKHGPLIGMALYKRRRHLLCIFEIDKPICSWNRVGSQRCFTSSTSNQNKRQEDEKQDAACDKKSSDLLSELSSPPNVITLARIASTPLLSYCIIYQYPKAALIGCLVAGASDLLDGYLARNYNMSTVLGTYLDPLADKILINVLSVSLWTQHVLPAELVALWLARDVALIIGCYHYVTTKQPSLSWSSVLTVPVPQVTPTMSSKINTTLQFATLATALCSPLLVASSLSSSLHLVLQPLCWATGITTIISGASYLGNEGFRTTSAMKATDDSSIDTNNEEKNAAKQNETK